MKKLSVYFLLLVTLILVEGHSEEPSNKDQSSMCAKLEKEFWESLKGDTPPDAWYQKDINRIAIDLLTEHLPLQNDIAPYKRPQNLALFLENLQNPNIEEDKRTQGIDNVMGALLDRFENIKKKKGPATSLPLQYQGAIKQLIKIAQDSAHAQGFKKITDQLNQAGLKGTFKDELAKTVSPKKEVAGAWGQAPKDLELLRREMNDFNQGSIKPEELSRTLEILKIQNPYFKNKEQKSPYVEGTQIFWNLPENKWKELSSNNLPEKSLQGLEGKGLPRLLSYGQTHFYNLSGQIALKRAAYRYASIGDFALSGAILAMSVPLNEKLLTKVTDENEKKKIQNELDQMLSLKALVDKKLGVFPENSKLKNTQLVDGLGRKIDKDMNNLLVCINPKNDPALFLNAAKDRYHELSKMDFRFFYEGFKNINNDFTNRKNVESFLASEFAKNDEKIGCLNNTNLLGEIANKFESDLVKISLVLSQQAKGEMELIIGFRIDENTVIGEEALAMLEKMFKSKQSAIRNTSLKNLTKMGEKAFPTLKRLLEDKDPNIRSEAVRALGFVGEKGAYLFEIPLKDDSPEIRCLTAVSLTSLGEKGLPLIAKLADDKKSEVRKCAASALGLLEKLGLPLLEELAKDKEAIVRQYTATSLAELGEEGLPLLTKLATDKEVIVRRATVKSLCKIGKKAGLIIGTMVNDPDPEVALIAKTKINDLYNK